VGHESINQMISRMCWALSLWLSQALEASEREAAVGDLVESRFAGHNGAAGRARACAAQTGCCLGGLADRLLFTTMLLPVSFSLCLTSQAAAHESAVYTWMYANNWDWNLAKNSGFWYVFRDAAMRLFRSLLTIAGWSWSMGFVLGILRRKFS
jgi:hypothetical protein